MTTTSSPIGTQQSPIDLGDPILATLGKLHFDWKKGRVTVERGHKLFFRDGGALILDGVRSVLEEGHIHRPSEHVIGDKTFAMEIHLVHVAPDGSRVVVGIFVDLGPTEHEGLRALLGDHDPTCEQPPESKVLDEFDPRTLLPPRHRYYKYMGSLTTPHFDENVTWCVLEMPIEAARGLVDLCPGAARSIQFNNRRFVLLGG